MLKDIFNPVRVTASVAGKEFIFENGRIANQADGSVCLQCGGTVVLVTVCSAALEADKGFFPLTVEYSERMYAAGRIPGSYFRREIGRPSERETLVSRLIDRPMRPLFDEELRNDVVLTNTILAQDYDNPVEIVASIGSSLVIAYSDIPWNGPTATTNVCYLDGKYIVNPSQDERNACQCFVTIASTHEKVVMIETEANEVKEDILMECIKLAHETNVKVVEFINTIVDAIGKPKFVTADMVKEGAIVIDVGINRMEDGKLCGDVDFDSVEPKAGYITPVPGGVGPMTIAMLMKNTLHAAKLQHNLA